MSVVQAHGEGGTAVAVHLKTKARAVFDVSGAGDTVIATIAAAIAGGAGLTLAAELANIAAGIAVGKVGTAPVAFSELEAALVNEAAQSPLIAPCLDWAAAQQQVAAWKKAGLSVGFTNGCFDIIHHGHVSYLAQARGLCDRLVVGLNRDASIRILKGETRPVNAERPRASVIGALGSVDLVVLFGAEDAGADNTPRALIAALEPDLFVKGGDYTEDQLPEAVTVRAYGGAVQILNLHDGYSTTGIIRKING